MAVRTDVVIDVLVRSLHDEAVTRAAAGRPPAIGGPHAEIASIGWFARVAETARFAPAREPMPWLAERLAGRDAGDVAAELAAGEPLERPDPGHPTSSSWLVPGPGGHVRHYLALLAAGDGDGERLPRKRAWMHGFYLRCCAEQASGEPGPGP